MRDENVYAKFAEALTELERAVSDYEAANSAASVASGNETNAANTLNRAQGKVDELLAKLKKSSPARSDWRAAERRGITVETP